MEVNGYFKAKRSNLHKLNLVLWNNERSTWSKEDFGNWGYTSVELIIHVFWEFMVVLVFGSVHTVSGMTPPSVQQENEEQWVNDSGIEVWSMDVEHTISFK